MSTLFQFERDLDAFAKAVGLDVQIVQKKAAIDLFGRIIRKTPVDTGRARVSWTIAVGEPDRAVQPEGDYPQARSEAIEALAASLAAQVADQQRGVPLERLRPIWISNNLPYIEALEQGHSKQAPSGMVELSIQETELELTLVARAAGVL